MKPEKSFHELQKESLEKCAAEALKSTKTNTMKQTILQHKESESLGESLISELQKLNVDFVIVHTSTFFDHCDEYFKAVIFYHE